MPMMAFESGIDKEDLERSMLPRPYPKVIYEDGWVYIRNFMRYHQGGPNAKKGHEAAIKELPERIRARIQAISDENAPTLNPLEGGPSSASASASASIAAPAAPKPFILEEKLQQMEKVPNSHLDIIASFIRDKPVKIENAKQLTNTIKRYARVASSLSGAYTNQQIFDAAAKIKKDNARRKNTGDEVDWTLETVLKQLTK